MGRFNLEISKPSEPALTTSTSRSETVNGSHEFMIAGYSLSKGIGIGKYVASDTFMVGGYDWAIYFYPDGKSAEDNSTYVSLFIALASEGTDVRALFELTLLDQSGRERHKVLPWRKMLNMCPLIDVGLEATREGFSGCKVSVSELHSHTFIVLCCYVSAVYLSIVAYLWGTPGEEGYKRFFKRSALETSDYLKDNCLQIRCCVGVVKSRTEGPKIYCIPLPPSDIGQQFGKLLKSGKELMAQLYGPMKDLSTRCIKVEDMKAPVFKALLHFMYWDSLPDMEELTGMNPKWASTLMSQHLLAAADRYGLDRLRLLCEAKLCEDVAINTVATTLALAEQHHCFQLKAVCLKFVALPENLRAVMQTDGFEYLKESCPNVLTDLLEYVARMNEHSIATGKQGTEDALDGSDANGRRVKQRLT
ncbi:hypothetical protein SASPL_120953 [Salvia splendens]|uniref:MATH domain-containing protein n=1 Tax=Salvia splendens TaxID=180675 RepID=A0A8X8XRQ3_SALSN|nr:hypothetical protein SASPL_120953 [Salvia splendens]